MTPYEKIWLWDPVRTRFYGTSNTQYGYNGNMMLSRLLKTDEFNRYMHGDEAPMPDQLRRQLEMLNGPHGETIFKVLEIRNKS